MLLVTHDTDEAFALGDRIAVMDAGRILQIGPRETVFARPVSRRSAEEQEPAESTQSMQSMQSYAPGVVPEDSLQSAGVQHSSVRVLLPEEQEPAEGERANVVEVETVEAEMARDTMRLRLRALPPSPPDSAATASESTPLELEIPAYAYYRLGRDGRFRFRVQLKPEWLHLMGSG